MNRKSRKRLDGVEEVVTKSVEVSRLVQPKFLTLTEKPANQMAFKVVRDDKQKETPMSKPDAAPSENHRRRVRSTKRSSLLYIEFPEGTTEEAMVEAMEEYGLEGYEMATTADGGKCAIMKRSDLTEIPADAITVMIGNQRRAGILRTDQPVFVSQDPLPAIAVIAIEFSKEKYASEDAAMAYIRRMDIDFLEKGVENTDELIRVVRSEVETGTETRKIEVEPGVIAVVSRAETQDLGSTQSPFVDVVCEECYGQWGWGQLDFAASMADVEFCEATEEASWRLRNVVDNIMFYSQLPVAVRKELIARATSQFSAYLVSLLDALPAAVVLINRSTNEKKEQTMTQKSEAKGAAPAAPAATEGNTDATQAAKDAAPVTRSEVKEIVAEAVAAAVAAIAPKSEPAQRSDGEGEGAGEGEPAPEGVPTAKAIEEIVTRSATATLDAVKALDVRLTAIEGTTTLRSDTTDSGEKKPADTFAGVFSQGRK